MSENLATQAAPTGAPDEPGEDPNACCASESEGAAQCQQMCDGIGQATTAGTGQANKTDFS